MKKDKLHNIKSPGFKTPNDYFKSFEDNLFEKLESKASVGNIDTTGFKLPKDYLSTVENTILDKIAKTETPVIVLKPRTTLYYIAGIAASFVLLFSLFFNQTNNITLDNIDTVEIESYLYQEDYTNDDLASLFLNNEFSETDFIDVNIPDETLDQYLDSIETEDFILE